MQTHILFLCLSFIILADSNYVQLPHQTYQRRVGDKIAKYELFPYQTSRRNVKDKTVNYGALLSRIHDIIVGEETLDHEVYPYKSYRRIIEGDIAQPGQFPYQASFIVQNYSKLVNICGGTIISERIVLTAGHCIEPHEPDFEKKATVLLGAHEITDHSVQKFHIEKYVIHPNYDPKELINDIALVKLSETIVFNEYIQKIDYARTDNLVVGTAGIVSGWGFTTRTGEPSNVLKFLEKYIVSEQDCKRQFGAERITSNVICAYSLHEEGACDGDSGGPLVVNGVVVGITSYTSNDCAINLPYVFTKISSYVSWIEKQMKEM